MFYSVKWDQREILAKAVEVDVRLRDFIEQSAPFFLIYTKMIIVVVVGTVFYVLLSMWLMGFLMNRAKKTSFASSRAVQKLQKRLMFVMLGSFALFSLSIAIPTSGCFFTVLYGSQSIARRATSGVRVQYKIALHG
ncbi:unnamed protein product [Caenorhabditis auriculariae]|uniref:Uncharacterized protein n=1 Tax=Caenorhabditis auriculariae TaxID=2777116 RepID=A0A8S1HUG9_9PELO|nr:unnamed protein product [Caenorhabditis auriculariae]